MCFAIRAQRINLGCCLLWLESLHKPYGGCLLSCWRMQPPATAATITVHLFFCAASCLSVSPLSAKPLRAEEHTENSCQAATQTTVYAAFSRSDAIRQLTYFSVGLRRALFTEALDVNAPRKLLSKCCILVHVIKKHLHKLCRDNNCCAGVPMTVELNRLVVVVVVAAAACAATTCGASSCTFCAPLDAASFRDHFSPCNMI